MVSVTTEKFRKCFDNLPQKVQDEAKKVFKIWKSDPYLNNLKFKKIHAVENIYSVRSGMHWRALGVKEEDKVIWFWIGSHSDYDNLI
ncbi:MAG: hypothetical protein M3R36_16600 [Bacteroidota bacterium]|nr:hypothetical protein [Bacteroidota bacterium]